MPLGCTNSVVTLSARCLVRKYRLGESAEAQGHPPDSYLTWGRVKIVLWTHKIDGLTESDFVLASKIDQISRKSRAIKTRA